MDPDDEYNPKVLKKQANNYNAEFTKLRKQISQEMRDYTAKNPARELPYCLF